MSESHPELPAVAEPKPPTIPGVLWALAGLIFRREALLMVAAVVVLVGAGGFGVVWAQSQLDGGVAPVRAELAKKDAATNQRIDALTAKFDGAEERNARRFEVLYNAVLERRPQPGADALMVPATDGGR